MSEIPLVDDLKYWRAERADEWVMDRFIRKAEQLTEENKKLKKDFDASKRFYEEVGYQKKSEKLTEENERLKKHVKLLEENYARMCMSEVTRAMTPPINLKGEEIENTKSKD